MGSSLNLGRPGKPPVSGGFDAAVFGTEFKGPVSDSPGIWNDPFSCAAAPVEVVRRSGAVGGTAIRPISAVHGSTCAVGEALGTSSKLGSFVNDGGLVDGMDCDVCSSLGQRHSGTETATAVESKRINGLPEVIEPVVDCVVNAASAAVARATAGESKGIIGSFQLSESDFPSLNSSRLGSLSSAYARRVARSAVIANARVCPGSSFIAVSAAVAHTHAPILHGALYNSWSDTGSAQCPTGKERVQGGGSGPAEDLRPVSEVETGVNFRPAGGVRGQVAGSQPRRQRPSLHPEVHFRVG